MGETIKASATGGSGVGTIPFQIGANGKLAISGPSAPGETPAPDAAPATAAPIETAPPTPFERLYPGVDPSKVEFFLEDKTNKLKFKEIAQEAPIEPAAQETPVETPTAPEPTTTPGSSQEIAQLRTQLDQQNQLMQAMLIAQAQGKPLAEVLGLATPSAAEPDYSQVDLYDAPTLAGFIKQTVQGAIQGAMREHQPALQGARQYQEYAAVQARHGKDPDFARKAELTTQLIQGNPSISYEATYNLVSTIQQSLAPVKAAAPPQAPANNASPTTLTPDQQQQKADQAARLPQSSGVRGAGQPTPPPEIARDFKKLAHWVAHQQALGNLS